MHTYEIRLSPKAGTHGQNMTTEVRASSDSEARRVAQSQFPGYYVEAVRRVD